MNKRQKKREEPSFRKVAYTERLVLTNDDWHPCIIVGDAEFVKGSVFFWHDPKKHIYSDFYWGKCYFVGGDDTGYELEFSTPELATAEAFYQKWSEWLTKLASIEVKQLKQLGFVHI